MFSRTAEGAYCIFLFFLIVAQAAHSRDPIKDQRFVDSVVESALKQVDYLAQTLETLDDFGKNTLEQSATVLDMGSSAEPVLTKWLKNKRKNRKTRYWIADMLAYVGTANSTGNLLKIVRNKKEPFWVQARALDSISEIWKRHRANTRKLQSDLETILAGTKDPKLRDKIQQTILEIDI